MRSLLRLVLVVALVFAPLCAIASDETGIGVLVMAPGGTSQWRKIVKRAVKDADLPYPSKIFYGQGDNASELKDLQDDVHDLEDDGAHTIVVVPLLVSSYSEVYRQWKYLLGASVQPGFTNNPLFPIDKHSTIQFGEPLNDSAVVVEILLDRIHEISTTPAQESVMIVAHGPLDDSSNAQWSDILSNISGRIRDRGHFKSVEGFPLRDESAPTVRGQSIRELRDRVEAISRTNRVIVVSLLLSSGGIESKIGLELRGLNYVYNAKTLLPDSRISEWIRSQTP